MGEPRVVASIEARMNASRLPGKMMADVYGYPAITRLLGRMRLCKSLDDIVLATTVASVDDQLEKWADSHGVACYRGSEEDVLGRVVEAHSQMGSDVVVEVNGDTILLDPEVIDLGVTTFKENDCDVVSNVWKRSFPDGIDVQVFSLKHLANISESVDDPAIREHVSLYFYEHPELYKIIHLMAPERWHAPEFRFVLDYPEDLKFITEVYSRLGPELEQEFGIEQIMRLLKSEPELLAINRHCVEKPVR